MKGFENDFDDSNRFFVKSAGTTPKRTTTPKMKRKKMRRRSGRSDDDDEVFFFFFFVDAGEEGDARLLRPPNPSSSSIFFFLLRINKQRGGEGGKKNEEDEEQKKKEQKQKKQHFFRFFLLFCFALCLLILRFKNISVSKEGKKVSLTEKVTFLLFYIAPHKTRAQNAKHSPLSRSKIHIFDSYILQVKRSTRAAINGSFAHHPQTNKRIVIWKGKKIPSSIFFYKKRP